MINSVLRKTLATILVLSVILSFAGCHGQNTKASFDVPDTFDTEKNFEITFWAKNDTNKTQSEIYNKAISDFEELYPNIKVNIRLYTDYSTIYNDVINNISTDTTPNVCITYPDHIATYLTGNNVVAPLDDLFADIKYGFGGSELRYDGPKIDEVVPEFLSEGIIGKNNYAIPFMRSTEACYVNKTFIEKLGYTLPETLTWDFVWEISEKAMEKNADGTFKINGQNVMIPFIYKSSDNMLIQLLRQTGGGYSTDAGDIEIFNDTTKDLLKEIASHARTGAFSTFKISSYPANFLNAGQCIFAIDSTAGSTWMGSNAPLQDIASDKIVGFETEVMTIPQYDTENPVMISQGPSVCIFNKEDPQEVLASWLFAQYLLTNETQIAYAKTEGYIPVTLKAQNSEEYKEYLSKAGTDNNEHYDIKIKASELLTANTGNTFVTPVFNGSTSLRSAASHLVESVTKAEKRKQTVDDTFIEKLYSETISLFRLDSIGTDNINKDLGPLPTDAKALICVLGCTWAGILIFVSVDKLKKKKKAQ